MEGRDDRISLISRHSEFAVPPLWCLSVQIGMPMDLMEVVTRMDSGHVYTRLWSDNELVDIVEGRVDATGIGVVETYWPDVESELGYWRGSHALARSAVVVERRKVEFDPSGWLPQASPRSALPGASFSFCIGMSGLFLNPTSLLRCALTLQDGLVCDEPSAEMDLAISGDARDLVPWVIGRVPFRDIAARVDVDGDIMLLGALAGVLGMRGGFDFQADIALAVEALIGLVEDHRHVADEKLRWSL